MVHVVLLKQGSIYRLDPGRTISNVQLLRREDGRATLQQVGSARAFTIPGGVVVATSLRIRKFSGLREFVAIVLAGRVDAPVNVASVGKHNDEGARGIIATPGAPESGVGVVEVLNVLVFG